jgi:hypothetical protein
VSELGRCLFNDTTHRVRDITILGDSQGRRYALWMADVLRGAGGTCDVVANEGEHYYQGVLPRVQSGQRDCGGCNAFTIRCVGPEGARINVEYVVMEFILDFELTQPTRIHWDHGSCSFSEAVPCRWAWSTQQLLFDQYFRSRPAGYPSEIHYFQNVHDCARRNPADFRRDVRWLLTLMNDTVPATSNIYLWEAAALNSDKQPMDWARVTSDNCAQMMNGGLQDEAAPFMTAPVAVGGARPGPRFHATFSLFNMSAMVAKQWNTDGVHYQDQWYANVARMLAASHCPNTGVAV